MKDFHRIPPHFSSKPSISSAELEVLKNEQFGTSPDMDGTAPQPTNTELSALVTELRGEIVRLKVRIAELKKKSVSTTLHFGVASVIQPNPSKLCSACKTVVEMSYHFSPIRRNFGSANPTE